MAKQLISVQNLDAFINADTRKIHVDQNMILSPGAKDLLRNRGIAIEYGPAPEGEPEAGKFTVSDSSPADIGKSGCLDSKDCPLAEDCLATGPGPLCKTLARAEQILAEEYGIKDRTRLQALSRNIIEQLKTNKGDR